MISTTRPAFPVRAGVLGLGGARLGGTHLLSGDTFWPGCHKGQAVRIDRACVLRRSHALSTRLRGGVRYAASNALCTCQSGGSMKVGIIGAGNMGSAFARRLSSAGHDVLITSRNIDDAKKVAASVGSGVRAVPQQQLAESVDVLIAATPYAQQANALGASGKLDGKAVIEISNPLKPDMSGLAVGHTTSAAEEVAKATPRARIVKAFNTIFAQLLSEQPTAARGARVQV